MPSTVTVRSLRGKLTLSTPPGCIAPARPIACAIAAESSGTTGPRSLPAKLAPREVAGPGAISPPRHAPGTKAAASNSKYFVTITHLHVEAAVVLRHCTRRSCAAIRSYADRDWAEVRTP